MNHSGARRPPRDFSSVWQSACEEPPLDFNNDKDNDSNFRWRNGTIRLWWQCLMDGKEQQSLLPQLCNTETVRRQRHTHTHHFRKTVFENTVKDTRIYSFWGDTFLGYDDNNVKSRSGGLLIWGIAYHLLEGRHIIIIIAWGMAKNNNRHYHYYVTWSLWFCYGVAMVMR